MISGCYDELLADTLSKGASTVWFPLSQLHLYQLFKYSSNQVILPKQTEGDRVTVNPFTKEALWESSIEDHHLSSLVPLSVTATSSHTNRDETSQTEEELGFSAALKQLQMVTQAKSQLELELLLKQEELA